MSTRCAIQNSQSKVALQNAMRGDGGLELFLNSKLFWRLRKRLTQWPVYSGG